MNDLKRLAKLRGNEAEILVRNKLRKYNYKVRQTLKGEFDLIVDDGARVDVKSSVMNKHNSWSFSFGSKTPRDGTADVYALVFYYPDLSSKIRYISSAILAKIMRENGSVWNVTFRSIDEGLEKSPYKVFGYPQYTLQKGLTPKIGKTIL